jgi:hypothetical protein
MAQRSVESVPQEDPKQDRFIGAVNQQRHTPNWQTTVGWTARTLGKLL